VIEEWRRAIQLLKSSKQSRDYIVGDLDLLVCENTGRPVLLMELMEGDFKSYRKGWLNASQNGVSEKVVSYILWLANAVAGIHRSDVFHRDLGPKNILFHTITEDNQNLIEYKLADFGLSKYIGQCSPLGPTKAAIYCRDIQSENDTLVDLYAIGHNIFFAYHAKEPWEVQFPKPSKNFDRPGFEEVVLAAKKDPQNIRELCSQLPRGINDIVFDLMNPDWQARKISSARELRTKLSEVYCR
jgi:serine/threonine protein kinase